MKGNWNKAVVVRMGLSSLFRSGFNSSKCKTMAKMAVARIKLLRNKREAVIRQMRRDIAMLLLSNQHATARIRVEHVIREQNIMAANELIELFCDLVVSRLSIIAKQRECPADLKEGISSLLFAGPRCSELPELLSIRDIFQKKYGKDFVSAATDLRPNAGVNRLLIEKLSVKTPSGETKLKVLKEIAKEYQVQWDTAESEVELLKPPEERIEGPTNFVSATSFPLKPVSKQQQPHEPNNSTNSGQSNVMSFQDLASAAGAAAEKAAAAAEAAVLLAYRGAQMSGSHNDTNTNSLESSQASCGRSYGQNTKRTGSSERSRTFDSQEKQNGNNNRRVDRRQSYNCERGPRSDMKFDESDYDEEIEMEEPPSNLDQSPKEKKMDRRHSYNVPPAKSDIVFDESDNDNDQDEEGWGPTTGGPPDRLAPQVPDRRVHPKLPDYEALAARFEALKHHKSSRT